MKKKHPRVKNNGISKALVQFFSPSCKLTFLLVIKTRLMTIRNTLERFPYDTNADGCVQDTVMKRKKKKYHASRYKRCVCCIQQQDINQSVINTSLDRRNYCRH